MEMGRLEYGQSESIHASNDDDDWKFEGRKRIVTDSIQPRIRRGINRLANFEHKAFRKIVTRGIVVASGGLIIAWAASAIGASAVVSLAAGGVVIFIAGSVYAAGSLGLRVLRAIHRHGIRVDETTRDRLDAINRDREGSR